ncbi:MAG: glycosyltransferase [Nostoc sp.]|uniref:glycosyltransferase n=1 Tax=Nostoc sp. TaxID=1180 RepID=UPI002FF1975D
MKFSLIVATKNRVNEVDRFLRSLTNQVGNNFEVIIVDQNLDDRLTDVVNRYSPLFPITHIKLETPGTSRARNRGIVLANGDIIAFPDDDCLYPPGFLTNVAHFFEDATWDGLTVRVMDLEGDRDAFDHCLQESCQVDYTTGVSVGIGPSMFWRSHLAKKVAFDEDMGPGATWVGGEDTDYLLRCLDCDAAIYYNFDLFVRHPRPNDIYSLRQLIRREFTYGRGCGYLMRKHNAARTDLIREFLIPFWLMVKYTVTGKFRDALTCPGMGIARILGYWEAMQKFKGGNYHEFEVRSN